MEIHRLSAAVGVAALISTVSLAATAGYGMRPPLPAHIHGAGPAMPPHFRGPCRPMHRYPPVRPHAAPIPWSAPAHPSGPAGAPEPERLAAAEIGGQADPAVATTAGVGIARMRFEQPTVTIKKGGTVSWQNAGPMPHTVTANDGRFGSRQLQPGDSYSRTFDETGTFGYYCSLHPGMTGRVVVVE